MDNKYYAWCGHHDCKNKETCLRYTDDKEVRVVNFKALIKNDECRWLKEIKLEVKKSGEDS